MSKSKKTKKLDKNKNGKSLPDMSPNLSEMMAFLQEEERKQYSGGGFAFGRKAGGFGEGLNTGFSGGTGASLSGAAGGVGGDAISSLGGAGEGLSSNAIGSGISTGATIGAMAIDNIFQGKKGYEHVGGSTASSALEMGGKGAAIGMMAGPVGGAIGGGLGLLAGGIMGKDAAESANNARRKQMESTQGSFDDSGIKRMMEHGGSMEQMPAMPEGNGDLNINHYEGNKHENGGIPLGDDTEVEAGETRVEDYIFSDKLTLGDTGKTFADLAKKIEKKYDRKDDPATTRALKKEFQKLITLNEASRMEAEAADRQMMEENIMAYGGYKKKKKMYDEGGFVGEDYINQPKKANKIGAPEIGAIASSLPAMANLVMGAKGPANTEFEKVTPQTISLQKQRDLAGRDTAMARSIARENARRTGSSGQYLSNMATMNSALTEGKIRGDLQSYLQEESMNTRIRNQADQVNTDISNREIIANEQNAAAADKFRGAGLADLAGTAQGYTKDKSLYAENDRYNKQVLGAINASFPNYKWGVNPETDEMMIQFATNQMRKNG